MFALTEAEYVEHEDSRNGFCKTCQEITSFGDTEADAEGYECPVCGKNTVLGVPQALLEGLIDIK